jgi:Ca-activated chloride channel family protein
MNGHRQSLGQAIHGILTLAFAIFLAVSLDCRPAEALPFADDAGDVAAGELAILDEQGAVAGFCPLKTTHYEVEVSGQFADVRLRQVFENTSSEKIEAVYTFPMSERAAVTNMTMTIGDRVIVAEVMERDLARSLYEAAKEANHAAALLEQHRPNIFTQSVANLEPGATIEIEIGYVENVDRRDGEFTLVLPMTITPRYAPSDGSAPDTSIISPMPVKPPTRAGHDVSIEVVLDSGGPGLDDLRSELHEITEDVAALNRDNQPCRIEVSLVNEAEIPNRDFVLHWRYGNDKIEDAVFTHVTEEGEGFFTILLEPPQRVEAAEILPREIIFVMDTSGSMMGYPIEKSKDVMVRAIDAMRPADTFNVITFSGFTSILWPLPRPNTPENRALAIAHVQNQQGSGGTEMMKAIDAALRPERDDGSVSPMRLALFFTDGAVGNDFAIVEAVRKHAASTRVFSFGIGNSVNRFLLSSMAYAGRGEVEFVTQESDADAAVARFVNRIEAPILTEITVRIDGSGAASELVPVPAGGFLPDLFDSEPLVLHGRFDPAQAGDATIRITGRTPAGDFERVEPIVFPAIAPEHKIAATFWARAQIDALMDGDLQGMQSGNPKAEIRDAIIDIAIKHHVLSQFTSFVAVEMQRKTIDGKPVLVPVPVELPSDTRWEGFFGGEHRPAIARQMNVPNAPGGAPATRVRGGFGGGSGMGGGGGGFSGGGGGDIFEENDDEIGRPTAEDYADELIEIITESIDPERWEDNGGLAATIRYYNGMLIINAPPYIHRKVEEFLADIQRVQQDQALHRGPPHMNAPRVVEFAEKGDLASAAALAAWVSANSIDFDLTEPMSRLLAAPPAEREQAVDALRAIVDEQQIARAQRIHRDATIASRLDEDLIRYARLPGAPETLDPSYAGARPGFSWDDQRGGLRLVVTLRSIESTMALTSELEALGCEVDRTDEPATKLRCLVPIGRLDDIAMLAGVLRIGPAPRDVIWSQPAEVDD